MSAKRIVITVSQRALRARIIRALRARGQRLAVDRRGGEISHIVIDDQTVVKSDVDLTQLARELKLPKPWEKL